MTARPYTDDDLRAEAARQHAASFQPPAVASVGAAMEESFVEHSIVLRRRADDSTEAAGLTWRGLLPRQADNGEAYSTAQAEIHDLITGAADLSEWAVRLGAEGLEPDGHTLQFSVQGPGEDDPRVPSVRLLFAFHPGMDADGRGQFVAQLSKTIAQAL